MIWEAGGGNEEKVIFILYAQKISSCSHSVNELIIVQVIANIFFVDYVWLELK